MLSNDDCERLKAGWLSALNDPAKEILKEKGLKPDLDSILSLFPPLQCEPAFDQTVIKSNIERLRTSPEVDTGHPFLDLSVKTGLAFIDATFQGDHPKYGVKHYGESCHDGFPPTIVAAVDALSAWGLNERAARLFKSWLESFVRPDGWIFYRGTSLSELGQLLNTASVLEKRDGGGGWLKESAPALERIAGNLTRMTELAGEDLVSGVPEDDEKDKPGRYFHNNAWIARGLSEWSALCERSGLTGGQASREKAASLAEELARRTVEAIKKTWPEEPGDWWLPPQVEEVARPASLTAARLASYTNYRYWPELLSSGVLPAELANRVVDARLSGGGQFCGATRFENWLDDWPLADYLQGLWDLGRKEDFLLSLHGHIALHQAQGHLSACEQATMPPGKEKAPFCLPCQLVAARAARLLLP